MDPNQNIPQTSPANEGQSSISIQQPLEQPVVTDAAQRQKMEDNVVITKKSHKKLFIILGIITVTVAVVGYAAVLWFWWILV